MFPALAVFLGVAGLVRASQPAFETLKVVGGAYLVFLGLQSFRAARRGAVHEIVVGRPIGGRAFRQGVLNDLANPKMAAFFLSLLPQFAGRSVGAFLFFGTIFCLMTFGWLSFYAALFDRARRLVGRRVRQVLDAISGAVLIALGCRLVTE